MIVKEAIDLICQESETMIIEWADTQDGYGVEVINGALQELFEEYRVKKEDRKVMIAQLKALILLDMAIGKW